MAVRSAFPHASTLHVRYTGLGSGSRKQKWEEGKVLVFGCLLPALACSLATWAPVQAQRRGIAV